MASLYFTDTLRLSIAVTAHNRIYEIVSIPQIKASARHESEKPSRTYRHIQSGLDRSGFAGLRRSILPDLLGLRAHLCSSAGVVMCGGSAGLRWLVVELGMVRVGYKRSVAAHSTNASTREATPALRMARAWSQSIQSGPGSYSLRVGLGRGNQRRSRRSLVMPRASTATPDTASSIRMATMIMSLWYGQSPHRGEPRDQSSGRFA